MKFEEALKLYRDGKVIYRDKLKSTAVIIGSSISYMRFTEKDILAEDWKSVEKTSYKGLSYVELIDEDKAYEDDLMLFKDFIHEVDTGGFISYDGSDGNILVNGVATDISVDAFDDSDSSIIKKLLELDKDGDKIEIEWFPR